MENGVNESVEVAEAGVNFEDLDFVPKQKLTLKVDVEGTKEEKKKDKKEKDKEADKSSPDALMKSFQRRMKRLKKAMVAIKDLEKAKVSVKQRVDDLKAIGITVDAEGLVE